MSATIRCMQRSCRRRTTSPGFSGRVSIQVFARGLVHSRTTGSFALSLTPRRPMYHGRDSPPGSSGASTRVVAEVRSKLKPDWIAREPVRARLRSAIKRLLARRNYLPDEAPESIDLVLKQMEQFANEWSTNGTQDS
ncbi:DUF3387 domain-containing protein [Streptomyces sp. ID05-39B]|uniref:type I restriction enzyme endonuclease domain-containing protein n=1 Tax=Streptomyces sp. ID05-39B TaxID=3028664 RepID=UPI0029B86E33|nr:type I restriction enzyme endonuclease domain-containing protein [Streptomyces sp. ID05-39B]MDX3528798.1 DUF3387 domain-containing protein [Streptomyces sp. ID05-39B]MDX3528807.1 DUF3387 domain-containing protein [Streptomyces sp. ID05-39B]